MCSMCANAIREPTQTLTGTGTGIPPIIVLLLLSLAIMFITASVCHAIGIFQRSAFYRLDRGRKDFEGAKDSRERDDSLPLPEGSEEYLEIFAEDHAR